MRKINRAEWLIRKLWKCLRAAAVKTIMHDGIEHAGYLAFLGLLSFFPFLVFLVAIAGMIGQASLSAGLINDMLAFFPPDVREALEPRVAEILSGPPQGILTIAIIGVIWTASSAVEGTRTVLNRAYRVATPPAYIWRRLLSIAQFLAVTLAVVIGMFLQVLGPLLWQRVSRWLKVDAAAIEPLWNYLYYGVSVALLFLAVSLSYYILPNIRQRWRRVVPGALATLLLWLLAAWLFSLYLQNFDQVNLVYGSLGGIIAALIFFYMLGVIYIFGAEFNYFFERAMGRRIVQKVRVRREKKTPVRLAPHD